MQPTTATRINSTTSSTNMEEPKEPPEVFCDLGSLIVEGRLPRGDDRGFEEGPHVPHPKAMYAPNRHECSQESYMCKKDENFRRHMLLLWQNNVPVSIEVLLSPDCRLGRQKARSVEFSTIPEPGSILLEQWTVSVSCMRPSENLISSRGLFQAVRSYLHFSQLSAWLASSKGKNPKNVLFRITIPGETFASKFTCKPDCHTFPPAGVGSSSSVQVSVRSLPRTDEVPNIICGHAQSPTSSSGDDEECKLAIAGALTWKETNNSESDLRKALVKSRLAAECQANSQQLSRSDSMDSMLGDSLLDPPQSLQKIPPKRYQSPSRCGSPSLETPEHLLFGRRWKGTTGRVEKSTTSDRLARQDLIRRRDMTHLYHGLHPRVIHARRDDEGPPRLSLPLASDSKKRNMYFNRDNPITDNCQRSGKHKCHLDEEDENSDESTKSSEPGHWTYEYNVDAKEAEKCPTLKLENAEILKKKRPSLQDIFDDGSSRGTPTLNLTPVTQVYRTETKDNHEDSKGDILLQSIIRTSKRNKELEDRKQKLKEGARNQSQDELFNTTLSFNHIEEISGDKSETQNEPPEVGAATSRLAVEPVARCRSFSEQLSSTSNNNNKESEFELEPLDISFDQDGWSDCDIASAHSPNEYLVSDPEEEEQLEKVMRDKENNIPTSVDKDIFRKSLDSAASMVFHQRTGLPLTSSPAPLRKGPNFDFDSSITSPHDIKRALFRAESQKYSMKGIQKTYNKRKHKRQGLSVSAPATITSSNLLGNFEESVLNGRLEPVSTVEGFTAEIGASGSFHPKHLTVPVTVFFYTLGDNSTLSSPYLGHINLGKKGYRVPEKGTIQVTLFNPLGTVVKMFVVVYNLSDMPPNSQTFLRQRTLYMPTDMSHADEKDGQKWLRYLIHLRFASSKSGKIYLHTDIRMIIFRKSDVDTATDHSPGKGFELRSFIHGPNNPKFSPRK